MNSILAALQLASFPPFSPAEGHRCAQELRADASAYRLAELPADIREQLADLEGTLGGPISDSDARSVQTDAPTLAERNFVQLRFAQALLIRNIWFVQFEVAQFAGVRTVSFQRRHDGKFGFSPVHYFGGPPCASIKAALAGVTTPGGL